MSSITQFKNNLKGGGARSNRFEVLVEFPAFAGGAEDIRKTPFLVTSTQLPGSTLGTIEQPFRGRALKLAGDRTFEEWPVSFLNDTDFALRDAFERWSNAINQVNSNVGVTNPDDYMSVVTVYQLDSNDNRIKEYVLKLAFPNIVSPIEVGQDQNDTIEQFEVTFQYSDLGSNTTT
ncbi:MAG: hypothetical protein R3230_00765 [Nitrosopumilaceae archaeon]|nr:hypothetical protein [Nitrosopumilaceae archaeon]